MRFIDLSKIDPNDPDVIRWEKKAKTHRAALSYLSDPKDRSEYFDKYPFWQEFKDVLIKYFGKLCWYSEHFFKGSPGDVDHFRPKNVSRDENGNILLGEGYYWLAYVYSNYRYSCENSNRPYKKGGKKDFFPVKPGTSPATFPNITDENVLLDPCNKDDCDLIRCNEEGSIVAFSSDNYDKERVKISVTAYNLNFYNEERKDIRIKCDDLLKRYAISYIDSNDQGMEWALKDIQEIISPKKPFSSFIKKYIREEIEGKDYASEIETILQNSP